MYSMYHMHMMSFTLTFFTTAAAITDTSRNLDMIHWLMTCDREQVLNLAIFDMVTVPLTLQHRLLQQVTRLCWKAGFRAGDGLQNARG